jgi:hypothetical protein
LDAIFHQRTTWFDRTRFFTISAKPITWIFYEKHLDRCRASKEYFGCWYFFSSDWRVFSRKCQDNPIGYYWIFKKKNMSTKEGLIAGAVSGAGFGVFEAQWMLNRLSVLDGHGRM